ncbi:MAG: hypothetical protein PUC15_08295 [Lentisphaeria bacterium]|nr:hypothetical protein [Lentisphaeria bacterium]
MSDYKTFPTPRQKHRMIEIQPRFYPEFIKRRMQQKMNEITEPKSKYNKGDNLFFANRDFWVIEPVNVFDKLVYQDRTEYFVAREDNSLIKVQEEWLFSSKRDAVAAIIKYLKYRIGEHRKCINYLQGKLDDFQSWNFQMRYMGEVIE